MLPFLWDKIGKFLDCVHNLKITYVPLRGAHALLVEHIPWTYYNYEPGQLHVQKHLEVGLALCALINDGLRIGPVLAVDRVHLKLCGLKGEGREGGREGGRERYKVICVRANAIITSHMFHKAFSDHLWSVLIPGQSFAEHTGAECNASRHEN